MMRPMRGEAAVDVINTFTSELSDRELATIQTLSVDSVSIELEQKLAEVCPNFECLILDYKHIEFRYRSAQWGKRSPGSMLLGTILSKFNTYSDEFGPQDLSYFRYDTPLAVTAEERRMQTLVATGTMLKANAKKLIGQLDLSIPFSTRLQFIRSVAALVALYPDEVAKTTTDGKTLQHFLWNSCGRYWNV